MADTKISALAAVASVVGAQEFAVNDAAVSKKASASQVRDFLGVLKAALSADHVNATTTGTVVADLSLALAVGTYAIKYLLLSQAPATTTGVLLGVNFTGTVTAKAFVLRMAGTGAAASTGIIDESTDTDQIMEGYAKEALSTTAPNLGIGIVGRIAVSTNALLVIDGLLVVSVAGNLELWHASEVAAESRLQAGSCVVATKVA